MSFSKFFIDRPIFAAVLSLVILVAGLIAMVALPISEYPSVVPPTVVVRGVYPGANPKVIAETVASPLEQQINGVEGMLYMFSQSTADGRLTLTITFALGTDLDNAQVQVQNRVSQALPRLPIDVQRIGVTTEKASPDLMMVVHLVSPDERYDMLYLSNFAYLQVRDELARIPGVGSAQVFGAGEYSMRVWLDPDRLAARQLTATDVVRAIREQNLQVAAGVLGAPPAPNDTTFQLSINAQGRLTSEEQFSLGVERQFGKSFVVRANGIHAHGTQFIIGRRIGEVFNPVVGGPDQVVNLESSVGTNYDALLLSAERRDARSNLRVSYTLGKAFNYANDDQIPFSNGPIDSNDLQREYGPTPNDRRHQFTLAGSWSLPYRVQVSTIWSMASGVPMDILLPGAQSRIPVIQRNAGNRQFKNASELNAFIRNLNAGGGVDGVPLPLVSDSARFGDSLNSLDARVTKTWSIGPRGRIDGIVEVFNIFNVTNVLGVSTSNYSGFSNVLVRDSEQPGNPGFLTSSSFGRAVTTAGGVFGTGGPRAFQLAVRASF
jgi:hypothetical protein